MNDFDMIGHRGEQILDTGLFDIWSKLFFKSINDFDIVEISSKYVDYVSNIIKSRWKVDDTECLSYVNSYLLKKNGDNCFVATEDELPIGVGVFNVDNDVGVDVHPWCGLLWVEPEYRGSGVGYQLTLKRFEWARKLGYKKIYLCFDESNIESYHIKHGWKRTGTTGIWHGIPEIIMEHEL